jgi:hypothetical protein
VFDEVWGSIEEYPYEKYFDEGVCYVFLVSHPQNRIVCQIERPSICLLEVTAFGGKRLPTQLNYPHPRVETKNTISFPSDDTEAILADLKEYVMGMDWKECTGILCDTMVDGVRVCQKVVPPSYDMYREIRGDEPNMTLRYLQLRPDPDRLEVLIDLFPEEQRLFAEIEKKIAHDIPDTLFESYVARYRKREYLRLTKEAFYILETTNRIHKGSNTDADIKNCIEDILARSTARQLNALLKIC